MANAFDDAFKLLSQFQQQGRDQQQDPQGQQFKQPQTRNQQQGQQFKPQTRNQQGQQFEQPTHNQQPRQQNKPTRKQNQQGFDFEKRFLAFLAFVFPSRQNDTKQTKFSRLQETTLAQVLLMMSMLPLDALILIANRLAKIATSRWKTTECDHIIVGCNQGCLCDFLHPQDEAHFHKAFEAAGIQLPPKMTPFEMLVHFVHHLIQLRGNPTSQLDELKAQIEDLKAQVQSPMQEMQEMPEMVEHLKAQVESLTQEKQILFGALQMFVEKRPMEQTNDDDDADEEQLNEWNGFGQPPNEPPPNDNTTA